jgi:cell division septal protein FtsQ
MKNFTQEEITSFVEEGLLKSRLIFFKQYNYFLISSSNLTNFLSEKIQTRIALEKLEIKKEYPNTLSVIIREKEPDTVWQTSSDYYYLDQKGIVVLKTNENEYNKGYPKIVDQNNLLVLIKEQIVNENLITSAHLLKDKLNAINIEVDFFITPEVDCPEKVITENTNTNENNNANINQNVNKSVNEPENKNTNTASEECNLKELLKASSELTVQTKDGYKIIFDIKEDLPSQISKLNTVLETKLKGKLQSIKYIDLRFEDKVYYQ